MASFGGVPRALWSGLDSCMAPKVWDGRPWRCRITLGPGACPGPGRLRLSAPGGRERGRPNTAGRDGTPIERWARGRVRAGIAPSELLRTWLAGRPDDAAILPPRWRNQP